MKNVGLRFECLQRVAKKHKSASAESVIIHAVGHQIQGAFSVNYLAELVHLKPSIVRRTLNKSTYFRDCGDDTYCKRERLSSLYKGALLALDGGQLKELSLFDVEKTSVKIQEPLIGYFMEVVHKYGDGMTLLDMAIQLAVYEQCTTVSEITERLNSDKDIQDRLDQLVEKQLLQERQEDEALHYTLTAKSSDIFAIIFKARAGS